MSERDFVKALLLKVIRDNLDNAQCLEAESERDRAFVLAMKAMGTLVEMTRPRILYQRWTDELGRSYSRRIVR